MSHGSINNIFCPFCGSLWIRSKHGKGLTCPKCHATPSDPSSISMRFHSRLQNVSMDGGSIQSQETIILTNGETNAELPVMKITCRACGNDEAYFRVNSNASKPDLEEIYIMKCTSCGNTWKEC